MNQSTKVTVIVVHWNTPDELKTQISNLKPSTNVEIIVVDNNSIKETVNQLKGFKLQDRGYKVVYNKKNLGFAKACNQGAKLSKGKWLLFLNPDTYISSHNTLRFLREAEELNYDAASLKPSSNNYSKPLPSALSLLVEFSPLRRFIPLKIFKQKTLFGGGLLIKKSVLNDLGGWDNHFFLWFEDSDITERLLKGGYRIGWIKIPHKHIGGTSFNKISEKRKRQIFFSSMSQYAHRHFNAVGVKIFKFVNLLNNR